MQQFVVPQFIDVEDKIFGPITVRQFLILLFGGMVIFLAYRYADFALFITLLATVGSLSLVFSFVKINGQTFHYFLLNIIQTIRRPSLRVWSKVYSNNELNYLRNQATSIVEEVEKGKSTKSQHIRDLALVVNTGGFYRPED
ncbi:MAG: PrgI family protein [Candidatus Magasanikiibacteriota bacterium]